MPQTFADVQKLAERDPAFVGELIANPKNALRSRKITLADPKDLKRVELFAKVGQSGLRAAADLVGFKTRTAKWGIGAGCCNGRALLPGAISE
jgi:hypothetical protein